MDVFDSFRGFDFYYDCVGDNQVEPVTSVQLDRVVVEWEDGLSDHFVFAPGEFVGEAVFVGTFRQARA
jgi:hypothetical protein